MKVTPIFNTNEITNYFYSITQEAFEHIDFVPNTYFNVPIYRKDMRLENLYVRTGNQLAETNQWSSNVNKNSVPADWDKDIIKTKLSNGMLYKFYYDSSNSLLVDDNYLHTYVFCYNGWQTEGKPFWDTFKHYYPRCKENIWFSYMHKDTGFDWHIDGNFWRYHQVLSNDGTTPSFVTRDSSIYVQPGDAFAEWTGEEHCVPICHGPRLHVIGSFS